MPFGGAQDFEGVKGRYARSALIEIDARIRERNAIARGTDREAQGETLGGRAISLKRQRGIEQAARGIGQQRVLNQLAWENALDQAGDDGNVEGHPAHLSGWRDKYGAEAWAVLEKYSGPLA